MRGTGQSRHHERAQTEVVPAPLNGFAGLVAVGLRVELRAARQGERVTDALGALV